MRIATGRLTRMFSLLLVLGLCTTPACSDDPDILSNEEIACTTPERTEWFEIDCELGLVDTVLTQPVSISHLITESCQVFRLKPCNDAGCGTSNPVEFQPWACFRTGCHEACGSLSPLHYPMLPPCESDTNGS